MHQHIKNTPGKLMNTLLKPSPEIPILGRKIKNPQDKNAVWACSRALLCPFLGTNCYFFLNSKVLTRLATKGAVGSGSSSPAYPQSHL